MGNYHKASTATTEISPPSGLRITVGREYVERGHSYRSRAHFRSTYIVWEGDRARLLATYSTMRQAERHVAGCPMLETYLEFVRTEEGDLRRIKKFRVWHGAESQTFDTLEEARESVRLHRASARRKEAA